MKVTPLAAAASDYLQTNTVRTIRFYGKLGAKFGRVHRLAVRSAAEAVRAFSAQFPAFDAFLTQSKDNGYGYAVFYGKRNLNEQELTCPVSGDDDIRFAPIIFGSKNGGWLSIIIGVVLIVVSIVFSAFLGPLAAPIMNMGIAMVVGGIVQLLTPVPKGRSSKDRPENQASYSFNGPINTQAQGNPFQVLYGRMKVGSAVISAGISAVDQAIVPTGTAAGGGGSGSGGGGGGGSPPWHGQFSEA